MAEADKQRTILLSVCGTETYQLIRNLVAPSKPMDEPTDKPTDKTFEDLVKLVQEHHTPPPSEIVHHFKFNLRTQRDGKSITEFVSELRQLLEHCRFEGTLDDMLQDRLACGIRDVRMQHRLLAKSDLKHKKASELAQTAEVTEKDSKDLQKPTAGAVHTVPKQPSISILDNCSHCGGKHAAATCRFKDVEYHFCHKKGHLAKVCSSKGRQSAPQSCRPHHSRTVWKSTNRRTLQVLDEGGAESTYTMFPVQDKTDPLLVTVQVNGTHLEVEVETGAACSIISAATYNQLWPKNQAQPLFPTKKGLCTYTRDSLHVKGAIAVTVHYQGQTTVLELVVVAATGPSLLGRDWLQKIKLDRQRLNQIQSDNVKTLQHQHADVFKD